MNSTVLALGIIISLCILVALLPPSLMVTFAILMTVFMNLSSFPCHRKEERCYKFMRKYEKRICSRCCSIIIGMCTLPIIVLISPEIEWIKLILLSIILQVPMLIDGATQAKKLRVSNNFLRTVTGLCSGIGIAIVMYSVGYTDLVFDTVKYTFKTLNHILGAITKFM